MDMILAQQILLDEYKTYCAHKWELGEVPLEMECWVSFNIECAK